MKNTLSGLLLNTSRELKILGRHIDSTTKPELEPEGYEFGNYVFDVLPPMSVEEIDEQITETNVKQSNEKDNIGIEILPHNKLVELQGQDKLCTKLIVI